MSGVPEAAASLFGSAEDSADPFAVIGTSPASNSNGSDLFPNDGPSDFLSSLQEPSVPFDQPRHDTQQPPVPNQPAGASRPQNDVVQDPYQYRPLDQPAVNHYPSTPSYSTFNPPATPSAQKSRYDPSNYQPRAPAAPVQAVKTHPEDLVASQYAQTAVPQQQAYGTYEPPAQYAQYTPSTYSTPIAPLQPPQANAAAPSAPPKAPLNRPKVVNAYDPPFPTASRRTARQGSSTYNPYLSQPMPPPSPFYVSNQFANQQNQPPPSPYPPYSEPPKPVLPAPPKGSALSYGRNTPPVPPPQVQPARVPDYGPPPVAKTPPLPYGHSAQPAVRTRTPDYGPPPPARATHARTPSYGRPNGHIQPRPPSSLSNGVTASSSPPPRPPQPRTNTLDSIPAPSVLEQEEEPAPYQSYEPYVPNLASEEPSSEAAPVAKEEEKAITAPSAADTQAADANAAQDESVPDDYTPSWLHNDDSPQEDVPQAVQSPESQIAQLPSPPLAPKQAALSPEVQVTQLPPPRPVAPNTYDPPAQQPYAPPQPINPYTPAPQQSNPYAPPAQTNAYAPPAQSNAYAPPVQSNAYAPPVQSNTYAPPAQSNTYAPPAQASAYAPPPPVANTYAPPPQHTSAYAPPPQQTSAYAPSANTYTPAVPERKPTYDPYAPPTQSFGHGSRMANSTEMDGATFVPVTTNFHSQLASPPMVSTAYAPSPSSIGTDDPLARISARAPVFSFGFGGRFVTCFHGASSLNTGFDVALQSRNTTSIKIHTLKKLLPKSALSDTEAEYPGPLHADPAANTMTLVRTGESKTKKSRVVQYLQTRADELSQGLGYLNPSDRKSSEAKLVLINVLKIMVENDGKLSGSPSIDQAIRAALVPRVKDATSSGSGFSSTSLEAPADAAAGSMYSAGSASGFEQPLSVTTLLPSALSKIEDLLVRGERKQAYLYALDHKLWAHAMVIASSIDKDAWKDVVNEFIQTELAHDEASASTDPNQPASGRDSLRVAYRFYSGQGAAAVQELIPKQSFSRPSNVLQPSSSLSVQPSITPRTPGFPAIPSNATAPESFSKWRETIAMIIASPQNSDSSVTLTALGDQLMAYNWVEAAHVCYLLSPSTSPLGGSGLQGSRVTLVGSKPLHLAPHLSQDSIILSEILEFALSLVPLPKGQEAFNGLSHLQPYRLYHAFSLAELGYIQEANRYCEAISACLAKPSPYFTPTFVHELRILLDRISGVSHAEKSNSWIGGKITKPSLDSIGGWLEGRFTKLVTGDGEEDTPQETNGAATQRPFDGPFAHYSTISQGPSARSSPQPRPPNTQQYGVPQRTSSAMAMSSPYQSYAPIDRASSAIDYIKHNRLGRQSPAPPVPPIPSHFAQAPQVSQLNTATKNSENSPLESPSMETPVQPPQASSWWDYSSGNASTPTATSFVQADEPLPIPSNEGFVSLMDSQSLDFGPAPASARSNYNPPRHEEEEDVEDLGFGNSKKEKKEAQENKQEEQSKPQPAAQSQAPAKPEVHATGWLSRWWNKSKDDGSPGPVKANLGEENSFYYDKELKRWVNKKGGAEEAKPAPGPPPPPSRSQTASPSKAAMGRPSPFTGNTPPPRSSSAMAMTSEAPPQRIRSNLVPTHEGSGTPPPGPPLGGSRPSSAASMRSPSGPPPPGMGPPGSGPPSRPGSQAAKKKNLRSRYVDVFQHEGGQ